MISPFKTYYDWLWSNRTDVPVDLLSLSSPVTNRYIIASFLLSGKLNYYLDTYFNNYNIWKLDKKELLLFIKQAVKDMKVNRGSISYVSVANKESDIIEMIKNKFPELKVYEVEMLNDIIEESEEKESIYAALGLDKPKKEKVKVKKTKKKENMGSMTPAEFIDKNFKVKSKNTLRV